MSIPSSQYQGILPPIPDRIIPGNRSTITTISMRYRWIRLQRWHQTRQKRNTVIWRQLWMWEFRQEATKHTRRWKLKTEWRRSEWIQLQKSKQVHSLKVNINQHTVKDSSQLLRHDKHMLNWVVLIQGRTLLQARPLAMDQPLAPFLVFTHSRNSPGYRNILHWMCLSTAFIYHHMIYLELYIYIIWYHNPHHCMTYMIIVWY